MVKHNGKSLAGAIVSIYNDSGKEKEVLTNGSGEYSFSLKPNEEYSIFYSKPGFTKSEIVISTIGFTEDDAKKIKGITNPEIEIFELPQDADAVSKINEILSTPLMSYYYDSDKNAMVSDETLDQSSLDDMEKIQKIVDDGNKKVNPSAEIERKYKIEIVEGDKFFKAKKYDMATLSYNQAAALKSSETYPKSRLEEIDKLIADANAKELANAAEKERITKEKELANAKEMERIANAKGIADAAEKERVVKEKVLADALAEKDRIAKEKILADAAEKGRIIKEKELANMAEKERLAKEKEIADVAEKERLAKEKEIADVAEKARLAKIKEIAEASEKERIAKEKELADAAEKTRLIKEKELADAGEQERIAKEKAMADASEKERIAKEKAVADAAENERIAKEKAIADAAEKERIAKEKAIVDAIEQERLAKEEEARVLKKKYTLSINSGDSALLAKNYSVAKAAYNRALTLKPTESYPKDKIAQIELEISKTGEFKNDLAKKYPEGITEEIVKDGNATDTRRIVVIGNKGVLYIMRRTSFGAIYYFKDGATITENEFRKNTEIK